MTVQMRAYIGSGPTQQEALLNRVVALTSGLFGGCTVWWASGAWFNPQTRVVEVENTLVVEVMLPDDVTQDTVTDWQDVMNAIGREFNQKAILYITSEVRGAMWEVE